MEQDKLEYYVMKYGRDIYSFCVFLTKNRQEADDLYQDTFLRALEKNDINDRENPKSYLISIAINLWNNKKRKFIWRKQKVNVVYSYEEMYIEQIAADSFQTEELAMKRQELNEIRILVSELPEKMRMVVLMYYMEEMTVEEISRLLKISPGTIKSRLHHARKILKEKMEDKYNER